MAINISFRAGSTATSNFDLLVRQVLETKVSTPGQSDAAFIDEAAETLEKVAGIFRSNGPAIADAMNAFEIDPQDGRRTLDGLGLNESALSTKGGSATALLAVALALITVPGVPG